MGPIVLGSPANAMRLKAGLRGSPAAHSSGREQSVDDGLAADGQRPKGAAHGTQEFSLNVRAEARAAPWRLARWAEDGPRREAGQVPRRCESVRVGANVGLRPSLREQGRVLGGSMNIDTQALLQVDWPIAWLEDYSRTNGWPR